MKNKTTRCAIKKAATTTTTATATISAASAASTEKAATACSSITSIQQPTKPVSFSLSAVCCFLDLFQSFFSSYISIIIIILFVIHNLIHFYSMLALSIRIGLFLFRTFSLLLPLPPDLFCQLLHATILSIYFCFLLDA